MVRLLYIYNKVIIALCDKNVYIDWLTELKTPVEPGVSHTWICCLLLLVVVDDLILIGHLHILVLNVVTAKQQGRENTVLSLYNLVRHMQHWSRGAAEDTKWRTE